MMGAALLLVRPQSARATVLFVAVSLLWLGAFLYTGDRRLYFPFTLQLAMQLIALRGNRHGVGLVGLFSVIRLVQGASLIVLAVELVVTGVALGVPALLYRRSAVGEIQRLGYALLASVLAFAGLVF